MIVICLYLTFYDSSIRGRLGSLVPLARNTGVLIAYIGGAVIKYEHRPLIFIVFPITFLMLVYFLPSTPQYYLKKSDFKVFIYHLDMKNIH